MKTLRYRAVPVLCLVLTCTNACRSAAQLTAACESRLAHQRLRCECSACMMVPLQLGSLCPSPTFAQCVCRMSQCFLWASWAQTGLRCCALLFLFCFARTLTPRSVRSIHWGRRMLRRAGSGRLPVRALHPPSAHRRSSRRARRHADQHGQVPELAGAPQPLQVRALCTAFCSCCVHSRFLARAIRASECASMSALSSSAAGHRLGVSAAISSR